MHLFVGVAVMLLFAAGFAALGIYYIRGRKAMQDRYYQDIEQMPTPRSFLGRLQRDWDLHMARDYATRMLLTGVCLIICAVGFAVLAILMAVGMIVD